MCVKCYTLVAHLKFKKIKFCHILFFIFRYKKYMSNIINENLGNAMLGGVPGTYNLVKSFVGVRLQGDYMGLQDGMIDGRPLWPMVYYCLRSGDINAALYCISTSNCADCQDLIAALESKYKNPDHADNVKLESTVRFQYRRFIRNSTDPFKRIVWCVVGCCDTIDEHSEVARTADDYLWLKLCLVRVDYDKDDHIKYEELQVCNKKKLDHRQTFCLNRFFFRGQLWMSMVKVTMTL